MNQTIEIDFSDLRDLAGGETEFIIDILTMIQSESPSVTSQMAELLTVGAYSDLASTAHKFKSSVTILGNTQINDLLKDIELNASEAPNPDSLGSMVAEVQAFGEALLSRIEEELDQLGQ